MVYFRVFSYFLDSVTPKFWYIELKTLLPVRFQDSIYVTFQSLGYKNRTPFCKKYYSFSFYLKHMVLNALARLYFLLSENHRFSLLLRLTNRTFLSRKAKKSPKMAIFPRQNLTNVFTVGAVFWTGRFSMCKIMFHFYLYNIQTK